MKLQFSKLIPASAALCLILASCKKNDSVTAPSSQLSQQLVNTTNLIALGEDEVNAEVSDIVSNGLSESATQAGCKVITYTPSKDVYPNMKTTDFGSGCTDSLGKTKSGKILTTVYADWRTAAPGTLFRVTTFSNYMVNELQVSGSTKSWIDPSSTTGTIVLKTVTTKTYTDNSGNTSTFIATHYSKQIAGGSTRSNDDDKWEITGTSTGTEVSGGSTMAVWRATIDASNPVIRESDCSFRTQGSVQIKINQTGAVDNEVLNYGTGGCDNKATLSVNGGTPEEITLPLVFYTAHL